METKATLFTFPEQETIDKLAVYMASVLRKSCTLEYNTGFGVTVTFEISKEENDA